MSVKSIIKWSRKNTIKTSNVEKIVAGFPQKINNYYELYVGDGNILFTFLNAVKNEYINVKGSIYAYDSDIYLIHMYKNIQTKHLELYEKFKQIITEYDDFVENSTQTFENYIAWMQNRFNILPFIGKCSTLGSAMLLFLSNNTGRMEIDTNGNYNWKTVKNNNKIEILDKALLVEIQELIKNVTFEKKYYIEMKLCDDINNGDFVYLNGTIKDVDKQIFRFCNGLNDGDNNFMLSTTGIDDAILQSYFAKEKYYYYYVYTKNNITRIKDLQTKENEIIITNYSG